MAKKYPKYSVLMAVYYKEKPEFLSLAIQSMLDQTVKPSEFVIVKDGPLTPELDAVINQYKSKKTHLFKIIALKKNVGLGPALKRGVVECTNELITRMDSDDYAVPQRMAKHLDLFINNQTLDIVGSNVAEFEHNINNLKSYVLLPEHNQNIIRFSKRRCPFRHSAITYKKSMVLKAKNYREFYLCEDYDLYVRMIQSGCVSYNIQEPLTYVRISKDFYRRRGGIKYLKSILRFKKSQVRTGYFSKKDYLLSSVPHAIVCLLPNSIRDYVYLHFLRKPINK